MGRTTRASLRRYLLHAFTTTLTFSLATATYAGVCPITGSTKAVYYADTGACADCQHWYVQFLDWWKSADPSLSYLGLTAPQIKWDCNLASYPNLEIYIQPGGNAYYQQLTLGPDGRSTIGDFLDAGGTYVGACAGWYYAAPDYWYQGSYYSHPNVLGRFPATVEGSLTTLQDYDQPPYYIVTTMDNGQRMLYWGGPTIGWVNTSPPYPIGTSVRLAFTTPADVAGLPAAVRYGKLLLTSTHPEAFEEEGFTGLTMAERVENYKWLANEINATAQTSFTVPPYAECHDGADNDGDGDVDFPEDLDCAATEDNDESGLLLFADGFELGTTAAWSGGS